MRESISFSKLDSGKWGIRVATQGRHPSPGDEIFVQTRKGETKRVVLGGIVSRDNGAFPGPAVYFAIQSDPGHKRRAANGGMWGASSRNVRETPDTNATKAAIIAEGKRAAQELKDAQDALAKYDPADFEWFDGEIEIQRDHEARLAARLVMADNSLAALRKVYRLAYL